MTPISSSGLLFDPTISKITICNLGAEQSRSTATWSRLPVAVVGCRGHPRPSSNLTTSLRASPAGRMIRASKSMPLRFNPLQYLVATDGIAARRRRGLPPVGEESLRSARDGTGDPEPSPTRVPLEQSTAAASGQMCRAMCPYPTRGAAMHRGVRRAGRYRRAFRCLRCFSRMRTGQPCPRIHVSPYQEQKTRQSARPPSSRSRSTRPPGPVQGKWSTIIISAPYASANPAHRTWRGDGCRPPPVPVAIGAQYRRLLSAE